jgi:hypothetical protein
MNKWRYVFSFLILVAVSALTVQAQTPAAPPVNMITADELKAKMSGNQAVTIIDVRG